jgi:tetratricopeptide (TPR) repeat protein
MNSLIRTPRYLLAMAVAAVIGGCASTPQPVAATAPPPPPARDRVAALRSVALATPSNVEVAPLQNPSVDLLLAAIEQADTAGDHGKAIELIDEALSIEPENPRLWQLKAEALLRSEHFLDAEKLAMKSYDLGPRIGEWCMRNWLLIAESRDALGDTATSESARDRAQGCPTKPLPRY